MKLILVFLVLFSIQYGSSLNVNDSCKTPSGKNGQCILAKGCPDIYDMLMRIVTPDDLLHIEKSKCGMLQRKHLVCCDSASLSKPRETFDVEVTKKNDVPLPEPPYCGREIADKIYGGNRTEIGQYGWMALIQYLKFGKRLGFHCGGSLINNRYILTAAHCIKLIPTSWKLHAIRLGEWDTKSDKDCEGEFCSDPVRDFGIEKVIVHEGYNETDVNQVDDIALIRLNETVVETAFINTICLPVNETLVAQDHTDSTMIVAGWGKTETASHSKYKLHVEVPGVTLSECNKPYNLGGLQLGNKQICAGGIENQDSCQGDSGGPLVVNNNPYFYLVGVVSFGPKDCGSKNIPGVYTKVAEYMDWIRNNMEPY